MRLQWGGLQLLLPGLCCLFAAGDASRMGRTLAARLKELLDRQQYEVIIQVWVLLLDLSKSAAPMLRCCCSQ